MGMCTEGFGFRARASANLETFAWLAARDFAEGRQLKPEALLFRV